LDNYWVDWGKVVVRCRYLQKVLLQVEWRYYPAAADAPKTSNEELKRELHVTWNQL
jgi:hypothetical protein